MRLVVVGAEEKRWNQVNMQKAKDAVFGILMEFADENPVLISGHCPFGGVDIWAEGYAYLMGMQTEIHAPQVWQWQDRNGKIGFRHRNMDMIRDFDALYVVSPTYMGNVIRNGGESTADTAEATQYKDNRTRFITRVRISETGKIRMDTRIKEPYHNGFPDDAMDIL